MDNPITPMTATQSQRILSKLKRDGSVDNLWAIRNGILRLGARIHDMESDGTLRKEGIRLRRAFGRDLGRTRPLWKNYYYQAIPQNK